jgi:MFS family permease
MTIDAAAAVVDTQGFRRAEDMPLARRLVALGFLCLGYFFYAWSWNTVDILRPYIAESLELRLPQVGSLYSAQALGALAGAIINGQLADRFGRRNALMVVWIGFGAMLIAGIFVQNYPQALIQRALMGYFMGSMYPITVGLYVALFSPDIRGRIASVVLGIYSAAVSALGFAAAAIFKAGLDWRLLLWAGAVPIVCAFAAPLFIPDDKRTIPWGGAATTSTAAGKLPIAELFAPIYRSQTAMLALMTGLNFFAFQAFNGWATTYLKTTRGFADADVQTTVAFLSVGGIAGGFFWGWFGDRFGRRMSALGFLAGAALVVVYLFAPLGPRELSIVAFTYGAAISCSVIWGPWLTELYPAHLRSTAASIFNWGRIISFFAPLATGALAEEVGLTFTMLLASIIFAAAALVWLRLPETLVRRRA